MINKNQKSKKNQKVKTPYGRAWLRRETFDLWFVGSNPTAVVHLFNFLKIFYIQEKKNNYFTFLLN